MKKHYIQIGTLLFVIAAIVALFMQKGTPLFGFLLTMMILLLAAGAVLIVFGAVLKK